jgi:twinkle protein
MTKSKVVNRPPSRVVKAHQPCPCGLSSDAYAIHDDGHGYCHSGNCKSPYFPPEKTEQSAPEEIITDVPYTFQYLPCRGLTVETLQFFGMSTRVLPDGKPDAIAIPFPNDVKQIRLLDSKTFFTSGPADKRNEPVLMFADKFPAGSAKAITITEGGFDAASVYQMLGGYPVVSVRSSSSAAKDVGAHHKYLNSFEKIYLALDDDAAGRKASSEIAGLFDFNKIFHVNLGELKDANGYLQAGKEKEFKSIWYNAKRYLPEGIVSGYEAFAEAIASEKERPFRSYPWSKLQQVTRGIRRPELILVTAQEGIGKTEFIRGLEHHYLTTTPARIATIHLEESTGEQLKRLSSYDLGVPAHFEGAATDEEIKAALVRITKGDQERLHIYEHPDVDDPDVVLERIRFFVTVLGCEAVFLDHLSQLVSGLKEDDERKLLDYLATKLARMVKNLNFTCFVISHINDDGQTRGSRYIGKVANTRIDLSRKLLDEDEVERNKTYLSVPKNRFGATTGPGGVLAFDVGSFTLHEYVPPVVPVPV